VLVCLIAGVLSSLEVYAAQLIWGSKPFVGDDVVSAFSLVSREAGGLILFQVVNFTLLVANMGSGMGSQLAAGRLLYGMGRGNALPKSFFGVIEPKRRIPRNNIMAVGGFAFVGAAILQLFSDKLGGGAYEIGAECLNFGAFVAFMGVNAAAFVNHLRHAASGRVSGLIAPALGFLICGFIWIHLSHPALWLGFIWMIAGIAYGAVRTRGFRSELVSFDIPPDVA
jgi:putrescine importer